MFTPYYVQVSSFLSLAESATIAALSSVKRGAFVCNKNCKHVLLRFCDFRMTRNTSLTKVYDRKHLDSYQTDNYQTLSKEDASELIRTMQRELRRRFKQYVTKKVLVKDAQLGDAIYKEKKVNTALVRYYLIGEYGVNVLFQDESPLSILIFPQGCKEIARCYSLWSRGLTLPLYFADNYVAKHQFKESKAMIINVNTPQFLPLWADYKGGLGDSYTKFVAAIRPVIVHYMCFWMVIGCSPPILPEEIISW